MRSESSRLGLLLCLSLLASIRAAAGAAPPPVFAIVGARITPVSGPVLESGTVVLRGGLIESVGSGVAVPADARIIDGAGLSVYPGIFDGQSRTGIPAQHLTGASAGERPAVRGGGRGGSQAEPAPAPTGNLNADVRAAAILAPFGAAGDAARNGGICTVLAAPARGVIAGQGAVVNLTEDRDRAVIKPDATLHVSFDSSSFGRFPGALMGKFAFLRQSLLDAGRQAEAWRIYNENPAGLKRPEMTPALQSLQPALQGRLPVVFPATNDAEAERALAFSRELSLSPILFGLTQVDRVSPLLAGTPVILSARFPEAPPEPASEIPEAVRVLRRRAAAPAIAGRLHQLGARFCFSSDGLSPSDFLKNVRKAAGAGLPRDAAIRALTLSAAEIFGVERQLGSLDPGKIANIVVSRGDILDENSRITHVFVDGELYEPPARPAATAPGGERPVGAEGRWNFTVRDRQGVLVLRQMGESLTGTWESGDDRGEIEQGRVSGRNVSFTVHPIVDGERLPVKVTATLEGDVLKARATGGGEEVEFEARREAPAGRDARPAASPVAGKWSFTALGRQVLLDLSTAGELLTGTYESEMNRGRIEQGRVLSSRVSFVIKMIRDGQEIPINFTGEVQGDTLTGKASAAGRELEFKATRIPPDKKDDR